MSRRRNVLDDEISMTPAAEVWNYRHREYRPSDWTCPKCKTLIFGSKDRCSKCNSTRDSEGKTMRHPDWICTTCDFLVFGSKSECTTCHALRPDLDKKVAAAPATVTVASVAQAAIPLKESALFTDKCRVCASAHSSLYMLNCDHLFCEACLERIERNVNHCPFCLSVIVKKFRFSSRLTT